MRTLELTLSPEEYYNEELLREAAARGMRVGVGEVSHVEVVRRSLDSRRGIRYRCQAEVYMVGEEFVEKDYRSEYKYVGGMVAPAVPDGKSKDDDIYRVVIVGAGPAGLFASLHALELGIKPIIVERGKPVEDRKKDITALVRNGRVDSNSNWCFGEGGAGTYSDGKLYTRSTKRGDVSAVLRKFVEHGADPKIMIDAHAHIGTDRLSPIIANMRKTITEHGGEIHFGCRVADLIVDGEMNVHGVRLADGSAVEGDAVVLATGHSARDIYELFFRKGWLLEAKPFAMGVRVEHPQELINEIQYHGKGYSPLLPPAAYSLTTQVYSSIQAFKHSSIQHGVFSFCMCPGGVIVPAATGDGEQVVNGMSNASRSSAYANSGIAVTVGVEDVPEYAQYGPLALLRFQQDVERRVFEASGGGLRAPGQRLTDFCEGRSTGRLNRSNYMGEFVHGELDGMLPGFVCDCLRQGFRDFGRKMKGFYTSQASLLAVESRTSSPVRIPRDSKSMEHPQLHGLYPCGEGAGYAGGIVSSALDGIRVIDNLKH
ncbi:MAG: FAD-dependent oxidoreductase [Bacteroidales bacterium]|nr:FAD-dependent oxidoreductase [Bacteroidales bacterium]